MTDLGYVDLEESTRAKLLKRAIEAAEGDACSCVVSHARVVTAADRGRAREQQRPSNVTYLDRSA